MTWTTEKPNKPGWYWFRSEIYKPEICRICYPLRRGFDGKTLVAFFIDNSSEKVADIHGGSEWQGPITPEE